MTACHCVLEKFAIIAVHGLGLVIVEYNAKEGLGNNCLKVRVCFHCSEVGRQLVTYM